MIATICYVLQIFRDVKMYSRFLEYNTFFQRFYWTNKLRSAYEIILMVIKTMTTYIILVSSIKVFQVLVY